MPDLEWQAPAVEDLLAIIGYIADDNPHAARALLEEIEEKVARLAEHPKRCRQGKGRGNAGARGAAQLHRGPCRDTRDGDGLRVLHAAQMWP